MAIIGVLAEKVEDPKINTRIQEIRDDRSELNDDAYYLAMLPYGDDDNNNPDYIAEEQGRIESEVEKLHVRMSELADDLVKVSRTARDKAETRLRVATWASYFLYAFGWGIGLLGRIIGVGSSGE